MPSPRSQRLLLFVCAALIAVAVRPAAANPFRTEIPALEQPADNSPLTVVDATAPADLAVPPPLSNTIGNPPPARAATAEAEIAADLTLPPARPTRVEVDIEFVEVSQIHDHDQNFEVEFNAYFVWKDPRLAFDAETAGIAKRVMSADKLWTPAPLLVNELDVDERGGATAHVKPDGTVYLNRYYRGTITGTFDLHEFPLDRHRLEVGLEATNYESDEVELVIGEVKAANSARALPHGWRLLGMSGNSTTASYARTNEKFSLVRVEIDVARDPHFYFWSIVLPLIPIMATAWSVFWMDPKEFSSQVGVGITAMLTVVAYRITIDSSLPPLTYMTRMDYFLLVCQTFVFIAFITTVTIHVLYALDVPHMRAKAATLTELCRWLPPLVLVAVNALLAFLPVSFGTYILLAPVVAGAVWFHRPLLRLPTSLRTLVRPELLLNSPTPEPPAAAYETPEPHTRMGGGAAALRGQRRRIG